MGTQRCTGHQGFGSIPGLGETWEPNRRSGAPATKPRPDQIALSSRGLSTLLPYYPAMSDSATSLLDLTPSSAALRLAEWGAAAGLPKYRATQLLRRLWVAPVSSWQDASELPRDLRDRLDRDFPLPRLALDTMQESMDGTRKYLWALAGRREGRIGPDPQCRPSHPLHLIPGGLRSGVRLLRHRADGISPQPAAERDRRSGA